MASGRERLARFSFQSGGPLPPTAPPPALRGKSAAPGPIAHPRLPAGTDLVDVPYIVANRPEVSVVREFFKVQAAGLSACNGGEASYL